MAWSSEDEEAAEEGEEEEEERRSREFGGGKDDDPTGITEYEKERMKTIQRNRDVLAKLQVKALATSLELSSPPQSRKHVEVDISEGMRRRSERILSVKPKATLVQEWSSSSNSEEAADDSDGPSFSKSQLQQQKKKKKVSDGELEDFETKKEDEEYEPSGNSDSEESFEPEEELSGDVPQSRKRKAPAKRTVSLSSQWASMELPSSSRLVHRIESEDEAALQQALALSLGSSMDRQLPRANDQSKEEQSSKTQRKQTQKRAKSYQDFYFDRSEIDAFFFSIVGSLEGKLSLRHLESAASDQNFTWTGEELEDMILMFDNDEDGQLNLAEFRSMAERCKLMDAF